MSCYNEKITSSINAVYQTNVANKLLQFMNKIRNESDDNQARRFIMELIQNARDLAYSDKEEKAPVSIRIKLTDSTLEFSHSGKVFSVKDILSIIHQVSSKNPGDGIGQFGTGFMSTYQLSEIVSLNSYIKEKDEPYKRFSIALDRTGCNKEEILDAIKMTLKDLLNIDEEKAISEEEFDRSQYNTSFSYHLDNDRSKRIAKISVDDMNNTLPYIMLFSDIIGKVEIIWDTSEIKDHIEYNNMSDKSIGDWLTQKDIKKISHNGQMEEIISIIYKKIVINEHEITMACSSQDKKILPMSENMPKVYIDFPLIGSEQFPFPIVINSRQLKPNEPRSNISLVDNEISLDAMNNKAIIIDAVDMYQQFLDKLIEYEYEDIYNVLHMPIYEPNKEWSEKWVIENLYERCFDIIAHKQIFDCGDASGRKYSIAEDNVRLIRANSEEERKSVQELLFYAGGIHNSCDNIEWQKVFEGYDVPNIWITIEQLLIEAKDIANNWIDTSVISKAEWIKLLYNVGMQDPKMATLIRSGEIEIFVNQNYKEGSDIELRSIKVIKKDPGIPEFLKDVSEKLNILQAAGEDSFNIRDILLRKDFNVEDETVIAEYEVDRLINYISRRADRAFRVIDYAHHEQEYIKAWHDAWIIMIANGSNVNIKKLATVFYKVDIDIEKEVSESSLDSYNLWRTTYRSVLREMLEAVVRAQNIETLSEMLEIDEQETIEWLNILYAASGEFISYDTLNNSYILLNQNGDFGMGREMNIDKIDDELKSIITIFADDYSECDISKKLVDNRININDWNLREYRDKDAAYTINNVVQNLLLHTSLSETKTEYQEACTQLLGWISSNSEVAATLFPAFSKEEDQMKLLTTKAAVNLNNKAREFDNMLKLVGVSNVEELQQVLKTAKASKYEEDYMDEEDYINEEDVYYGGDEYLSSLNYAERSKRLKEIGKAGENYVYNRLIDTYVNHNYKLVRDIQNGCIMMNDYNESLEIIKPDTDNYNQPGWDIKVIYEDANQECVTKYYEIKTNTETSIYSNIIRLSNEQMKMALSNGENYHLVRVKCNSKNLDIVSVKDYIDPLQYVVEGKLRNMENGYILCEK